MRVVRKIVEKKSWVLTPTGPSNHEERQREREHPRRGDFTLTGLLPFAFQTSLISAEPGPLDPLRVF